MSKTLENPKSLILLRPPRRAEHKLLVRWRNACRADFFSDVAVTTESHLVWHAAVRADERQKFFVADLCGTPIGTVGLAGIDFSHGRAEYGRFLIAPEHRREGLGEAALRTLLEYAFWSMNLNRVYGDILANNEAALALDRKLGFREEGIFRQHVFKGGQYRDVVRMAILAEEFASA